MLFSKEDLNLDHFPPYAKGFDPDEYTTPRQIFPQSTLNGFPRLNLSQGNTRPADFIDHEWHTPLRLSQIAWQAFYDEIDLSHISSAAHLEFFVNLPTLTEVDADYPKVALEGMLGRQIYNAFSNIKAVNNGAKDFNAFMQDEVNIFALQLLENGYFPDRFEGNHLILVREPAYRRQRDSQAEIKEARRLRLQNTRHNLT